MRNFDDKIISFIFDPIDREKLSSVANSSVVHSKVELSSVAHRKVDLSIVALSKVELSKVSVTLLSTETIDYNAS